MLKQTSILSSMLFALLISAGGCLMPKNTYTPVKYYQLQASPLISKRNFSIKIDKMSTVGLNGTKMMFKTAQCRILVDEYHRWLNPPATMITTALQSSFSYNQQIPAPESDHIQYTISGNVFEFIADINSKTARLGLDYQVACSKGKTLEESVTFSIKMTKVTPETYAIAMSKAIDKLAERINQVIIANSQQQ